MAWTTPTLRATGDLITASIWNIDVNNLAYLHGDVGDITLAGVYEVFSDAYVGRLAAGVPGGGSVGDRMAFHRTPAGNLRHIEAGRVVGLNTTSPTGSVSFGNAFVAAPDVVLTALQSGGFPVSLFLTAISTTGFSWGANGGASLGFDLHWIAEGQD